MRLYRSALRCPASHSRLHAQLACRSPRYGPVQNEAETKKEELSEIKVKTTQLEREAEVSTQQNKDISNQIQALLSLPTTEDAVKQLADMKATNQAATEKVASLKVAAAGINPEDKVRVRACKLRSRQHVAGVTPSILDALPF